MRQTPIIARDRGASDRRTGLIGRAVFALGSGMLAATMLLAVVSAAGGETSHLDGLQHEEEHDDETTS